MRNKRGKKKNIRTRSLAIILSFAMILGLLQVPGIGMIKAKAATRTSSLPGIGGTLSNGYIYTVASNTTINASSYSYSGLNVASNATVAIYIPTGVTLTVYGGNGGTSSGGYAGINLPSNATLYVFGGGTLTAQGGSGGSAQPGSSGGSGSITSRYESNNQGFFTGTPGYGGAGGQGAGGGGAGIGSNGASGGSGGGQVNRGSVTIGGSTFRYSGYSANAGSSGNSSSAAGKVYYISGTSVVGYGGSGGGAASGGSGGGCDTQVSIQDSWYSAFSGGGGGGGGGAGTSGADIGTGGAGGGGGGSGSTGSAGHNNGGGGEAISVGGNGGGGGNSARGGSGANRSSSSNCVANLAGNSGSTITGGASQTSHNITTYAGGNGAYAGTGGSQYGASSTSWPDFLTYTVTYSGNQGTGTTVPSGIPDSSNNKTMLYGQNNFVINSLSIPTRTGYTFQGWKINTGTALYQPGTTLTDAMFGYPNTSNIRNFTLNASWEPLTYTVNYNLDTVDTHTSIAKASDTKIYDTNLVPPTPTREGYKFMGWSLVSHKEANDEGDGVNDSETGLTNWTDVQLDNREVNQESVTLYAMWQLIHYDIIYVLDGGTAVEDNHPTTYHVNDTSIRMASAPMKDNYIFTGWKVTTPAQSGSGYVSSDEYASGALAQLDRSYGNVTLTAQWTENLGVKTDTDILTIPANTFEIAMDYEALCVRTYNNGQLTDMGSVDLYHGDTKEYTLSGHNGVYQMTKAFAHEGGSADDAEYKVYVNGIDTGKVATFSTIPEETVATYGLRSIRTTDAVDAAEVYYFSVNVDYRVNDNLTNANYIQLKTSSEDASPITLSRSGTGNYTASRQVASRTGENTVYQIWVDGKNSGQTASFNTTNNSKTINAYTIEITTKVDDTPTDFQGVYIVKKGTTGNPIALIQEQAGTYTTTDFVDDATQYEIYINNVNTGKTVTYSSTGRTAEFLRYRLAVTTTLDDVLTDMGTVTVRNGSQELPLVHDAIGKYSVVTDASTDGYQVYVNGQAATVYVEPNTTNAVVTAQSNASGRVAEIKYYTVTYDITTGTGTIPTDTNTYLQGTLVKAKTSSGISKTDNMFSSWNTSQAGTGTKAASAGEFQITGKTTLYAIWTTTEKSEASWMVAGDNTVYYGTIEDALNVAKNTEASVAITVKKDATLSQDTILNAKDSITVAPGATLKVDKNKAFEVNGALTNNGAIDVDGTLNNNVTIENNGTIEGKGEVHNNGTIENSTTGTLGGSSTETLHVNNDNGVIDGGKLSDKVIVNGGILTGDIKADTNATMNDVTIDGNGSVSGGTYTGTITNKGEIIGAATIGTNSEPGVITNVENGHIGNNQTDSIINNTNGVIQGGTIGQEPSLTGSTTITGGVVGGDTPTKIVDNGTLKDVAEITGKVENGGTIESTNGKTTIVTGALTNDVNGSIIVDNKGTIEVRPEGTITNNGTIATEEGSTGGGQLKVDGNVINNADIKNNGTMTGDGVVDNNGTIVTGNKGNLGAGTDDNLTIKNEEGVIDSGNFKNDVTIIGGELTGNMTADADATIKDATINQDGTVTGGTYTGTVHNEGTIQNPDKIEGTLSNTNQVIVELDKTTEILNGGELINNGTLENQGTIQIDQNGTLQNDKNFNNDGYVEGDGTLKNNANLDNNDGVIRPSQIENTDGIMTGGEIGSTSPKTSIVGGQIAQGAGTTTVLGNVSDVFYQGTVNTDKVSEMLSISFHLNGGDGVIASQIFDNAAPDNEKKVVAPPTPARSGYRFVGWYYYPDKKELTTKFWSFTSNIVDDNYTLYAQWEAVTSTGGDSGAGSSGGTSSGGSGSSTNSGAIGTPDLGSNNPDNTIAQTPVPSPVVPENGSDAVNDKDKTVGNVKDASNTQSSSDTEKNPAANTSNDTEKGKETNPDTDGYSVVLGNGTAKVAVEKNQKTGISIKVQDYDKLIDSVLSKKDRKLVESGATVEISVSLDNAYHNYSADEVKLLDKAFNKFNNILTDLSRGLYLRLNVRYRIIDGDTVGAWKTIENGSENLTFTFEIPIEMMDAEAYYYLLGMEDNEAVMKFDEDSDIATFTFATTNYGVYELLYSYLTVDDATRNQIEKQNERGICRLCGNCSTPLGTCIYIWILIVVLVATGVGGVYYYYFRKKDNS